MYNSNVKRRLKKLRMVSVMRKVTFYKSLAAIIGDSFRKCMVFFYLTIIWFKVIFWKHKQDMLMIEKQYEGYTNKISFWALYSIGLNRRLSIHVVTKRNQSWYLLYIMNSWDTYIMWLVDVQGCFSFTLILFCFFLLQGTSITYNGLSDIQ